jgi:nucleotide-binding universal stress UspA family protein
MSAAPFRRIVVPVDFSEASEAAWRLAGRLSARDTTLVALNVVVPPLALNVAYANNPAAIDEQRRENEARMAALEPPAGADGARVERRVVVGDAVQAIVDTARATRADLVVMGSEDREGTGRVFRRRIDDDLVRALDCHVLLVKPPRPAGAGHPDADEDARARRG